MSLNTTLSEQKKIVITGLRNSGKSSLMNNIFEKEISIISDKPGTTTDPVLRTIELGDLGPSAIIDTAGIDDDGELGKLRIKKSFDRITYSDIVIFATPINKVPSPDEKKILNEILSISKHVIFALTFSDELENDEKIKWVQKYPSVKIDNLKKTGIEQLKSTMIDSSKKIIPEITPVEGIVNKNDFVILVTPIDSLAPKGRLILPQVETIRDLLDKECGTLVVKETELQYFYDALKIKPKLVITDSQVFAKVSSVIPEDQMLTSFSILFARKKGDLAYFIDGIKKIDKLPPYSKILIIESCSHHMHEDDIGTVKIPKLIKNLVNPFIKFEWAHNLDEKKIKDYSMVINCAGCMITKQRIDQRIKILKENNIPATNYGIFLAWANKLLPRALKPFNHEYKLYLENN
ncbi:MAG: [FeFe] hydrogenase H-cluster maturation GTPase HydF [Spirochaetes bacterium]|nr:[FeFe] hydrogenase H-cluster maturation GTPase HydF [Spirochaetota bacterium]